VKPILASFCKLFSVLPVFNWHPPEIFKMIAVSGVCLKYSYYTKLILPYCKIVIFIHEMVFS